MITCKMCGLLVAAAAVVDMTSSPRHITSAACATLMILEYSSTASFWAWVHK